MKSRYLVGLLLLFFAISGSTAMYQQAQAEIAPSSVVSQARILHLDGKVEAKLPGSEEWKESKLGDWLPQGAEVRTTQGASCDIGLGDGRQSVVRMNGGSKTKIQTLTADQIRIKLEEGKIWNRIKGLKPGSRFEVESPTAVATARGTGWEQSSEEINVFESSVQVEGSSGESMVVEEGFGIDVDPMGDLKDPEPIPAEDKAEWDQFEQQAEQNVAQEASLPGEPASEESTKDAPPAEESAEAPKTEDAPESSGDAFDSFEDKFGADGEVEPPSETQGSEDVLGEAKEEQQENLAPEDLDPAEAQKCYVDSYSGQTICV